MISQEAYNEILLSTERAVSYLKESLVVLRCGREDGGGLQWIDDPYSADNTTRGDHARELARTATALLHAVREHWGREDR